MAGAMRAVADAVHGNAPCALEKTQLAQSSASM